MSKKKFEACLLRVNDQEFIVAEWDQLVTVADKMKLSVGSTVGYRNSKNKREKILRGTIVATGNEKCSKTYLLEFFVVGSLKVCQQQKTLFRSTVEVQHKPGSKIGKAKNMEEDSLVDNNSDINRQSHSESDENELLIDENREN